MTDMAADPAIESGSLKGEVQGGPCPPPTPLPSSTRTRAPEQRAEFQPGEQTWEFLPQRVREQTFYALQVTHSSSQLLSSTPPRSTNRPQNRMCTPGFRHDFLYKLRPRPDCRSPGLTPDGARLAGWHAKLIDHPPSPASAAPSDGIKHQQRKLIGKGNVKAALHPSPKPLPG